MLIIMLLVIVTLHATPYSVSCLLVRKHFYILIILSIRSSSIFQNKYFPYVSPAKEHNLAQISSKHIVIIAIGDENIKSKIKTVPQI